MNVGLVEMELRLFGVGSLKAKRKIVRRMVERTRARFGASIAETGNHDDHRRARIGFAYVASDSRDVESALDKILDLLEEIAGRSGSARIVDVQRELMPWHGDPLAIPRFDSES